jgi:DNA recombination protein Rad52
MFTQEQNDALNGPLQRAHVKGRKQGGRQVSYVEGWHVIAEANRVFGFDGWSRETVELKMVSEAKREIGEAKNPGFGVTYIVRVRVTVGQIVREGCGSGHGIDRDLGQAHESAIKEAETDAMKRAFMTFGNIFGLALYDKEQANVSDDSAAVQYIANCEKQIAAFRDETKLKTWWNSDAEKKARRYCELTTEEVSDLMEKVKTRISEIHAEGIAA